MQVAPDVTDGEQVMEHGALDALDLVYYSLNVRLRNLIDTEGNIA